MKINKNRVKNTFLVVQLEDEEFYQVYATQEKMNRLFKKFTRWSKSLTLFDKPLPFDVKEREEE